MGGLVGSEVSADCEKNKTKKVETTQENVTKTSSMSSSFTCGTISGDETILSC